MTEHCVAKPSGLCCGKQLMRGLLKQHFRAPPLLYIVSDCKTKPLRVREADGVWWAGHAFGLHVTSISKRGQSSGIGVITSNWCQRDSVSYPPLIAH